MRSIRIFFKRKIIKNIFDAKKRAVSALVVSDSTEIYHFPPTILSIEIHHFYFYSDLKSLT